MGRSQVIRSCLGCTPSGRALVLGWLVAIAFAAAGCEPTHTRWIGVNMQLGHSDYGGRWVSAKTTAQDRAVYFRLARDLGVTHVRDLFMSWHRVEPTQGQPYDFSLSDDMARRADEAGVDLLGLCWVIPAWAAADAAGEGWSLGVPRRDQAPAFVRFVTAFVERYDGDGLLDLRGLRRPIRCYEFLNEMEGIPVEEYAFWLRLFYRTVKAADPRARVVLGGLTSPGIRAVDRPVGDYPTYFDRLLARAELAGPQYPYFDAISLHHYPASYPGREPFADALLYLRQVMERHTVRRPVWLTEFGHDSRVNQPADLASQAAEIVKLTIRARALGVERAYLQSLWDYRSPDNPDVLRSFGLVREARPGEPPARKPAFDAFALLVRLADDAARVTAVRPGMHVVHTSRGDLYVAWREDAYGSLSRDAALVDQWWEVTSLDGKTTVLHGSTIRLNDSPIFLRPSRSPFISQ